jgi:signal transduction histidine kinase
MENQSATVEDLKAENKLLLDELATAYKNMETILLQSTREKEIAYEELENKFQLLQNTYEELSRNENLLIHLEKLSSIGQFITEIIHELNNPLTIISGVSELILLQDVPECFREQLGKIPEQVDRMSNYLNRFKAMAYKSKEEFQSFDINSNLLDFLETIEIVKPKDVKINVNISPNPLVVSGDPYQINQIYLNLAKNAFDAMSDKGSCLAVTSQDVTTKFLVDHEVVGSFYCQSKKKWDSIVSDTTNFALVEFKDDAGGIPQELISDIFTPFFTTKERGKGTGLGLSIATDIANRHNANLAVQSKIGEGTVFRFLIPLVKSDQPTEENILIAESEQS